MASYERPALGPVPKGPWTDRVRFSDPGGFAYRPGQVITTGGDEALDLARRLNPNARRDDASFGDFARFLDVEDPLRLVEDLRLRGFTAQPNHVFFADCASGCGCGPHPATACVGANPVYASPVYASPVYASPVYASPVYASPVYASPAAQEIRKTGVRRSSARPAPEDPMVAGHLSASGVTDGPHVVVLDTGFADPGNRPPALNQPTIQAAGTDDLEVPDETDDGLLDPVAGHGTFIAGIVDQVAPGCHLTLHRVIANQGDGDEVLIAARLFEVAATADDRTIVNLSFGGRALDRPELLASAVRTVQRAGAVVVASAGNDATCEPTFPAALPDVVGVGAIGPTGPAPFSNYGPWVRACAPGVDILSTFFEFSGDEPPLPDGTDPDDFAGWAWWSGTSFAAPVVAGALARAMIATGSTASEAVGRVIDAPGLMRIPGLGTVVNIL